MRGRTIADARIAPSLGIRLYNSRAVTTFGYVAQIYPPTSSAITAERSMVQRIFHLLNHTFPGEMFFRLGDAGAPQPTSLRVLSYASRFQAATRTITVWRRDKTELDKLRWDHGPCAWLARAVRSNPWWDTPPAVDLDGEAAGEFDSRFGKLEQKIKANTLQCRAAQRNDRI